MAQKATVTYASGLMLIISKYNNQPSLFLECVAKYRAGVNVIHKIINDEDSVENGIFKIRMNLLKAEMQEIAEYINANSIQ